MLWFCKFFKWVIKQIFIFVFIGKNNFLNKKNCKQMCEYIYFFAIKFSWSHWFTYLCIYVNIQTKSITVAPAAVYTALYKYGIINSLFSVGQILWWNACFKSQCKYKGALRCSQVNCRKDFKIFIFNTVPALDK